MTRVASRPRYLIGKIRSAHQQGGRSNMPGENFTKFVREMSEAAERLEAYLNDPEGAMKSAGLTEAEKAIIRSGDEDAILSALGHEAEALPRFRFRIRNIRIRL